MKSLYLLALTVFSTALVQQATASDWPLPTAKPEYVGLSQARLQRLSSRLNQHVAAGELAGIVVAVARRGKLAYIDTLGWANIEAQTPMARDTIFRIHSMTKPIASVAAMMLLEEGALKTTDRVDAYLPELSKIKVFTGGTKDAPELSDPARPITVGHLLSHTSGMVGMGYETHPTGQIFEAIAPYANNPTLETFVTRLAQAPLARQPGEEFIYGPSTDVLGRVIEVVSGQPFDVFLKQRILEPLGMVDTHFVLPQAKRDRFAMAYERKNNSIHAYDNPQHEARWKPGYQFRSGGGGLVSTIGDYLRFTQMLLNGGTLDGVRLLSPKTIELMTTPVVHHNESAFLQMATAGYGFGLGFAIQEDLAAAGKPGSLGEYFWAGAADTYFFVDPSEQLTAVLMTQIYPAGTYRLRETLQTMVYQALIE